MIRSILNSESFRAKTAELQRTDQPWTAERQENVLRGFIGTLKEAGVNPLQTLGILVGVAEIFGDGDMGSQKSAANDAIPKPTWRDYINAVDHKGDSWRKVMDYEASQRMAPPSAAPAATPGIFDNMKDYSKRLAVGVGGLIGRTGFFGQHTSDMLQAAAGDKDAIGRQTTSYIADKHPTAHKMVTSLFGEKNAPDVNSFFENIGKGEYSKAVGQVGDALTSNDFIQRAAPYVIPGLMGMAATKMMGGGWGTALGVGAGTGYLAGALRPEGGWNIGQYLKDKQAPEGTPSDPNKPDPNKPDPNKPAPVTTPKETESERLRRESAAHAEGAGKVSTP